MATDLLSAYEDIVALGARPEAAEATLAMRRRFETRTGAFGPDDPWFEARSRAFWDDAVTTQRFGRSVAQSLSEEARAFLGPLERAHRGLFRPQRDGVSWILCDVWSEAELLIEPPDAGLREALEAASLLDGRVVGLDAPARLTLLPGAVFHPADASEPIEKVIPQARERGLGAHETLDALLRMERNLRSHSRVKAAYAYRAEGLKPAAEIASPKRA